MLRPEDFDFANSEVKEFTESIEVTTAKRLRTQASSSVNAQSLDADRSGPGEEEPDLGWSGKRWPKKLPTHAFSSSVNAQSLDADRCGPGESEEDDAADEFTPEYCFPPLEARVKAMTREVQKRRANLALSSDLRTGKGNGHGAAVSSLTAVVVEALTIFL